jgi:hypothetical protein
MAFSIYRGMREGSEHPQAIVEGDNDCFNTVRSAARKLAAVIVVGFAADVSATVNPYDNRLFLSVIAAAGCENVEIKTILIDTRRCSKRSKAGNLRTVACEPRCVQRSPPALDRLRRLPAKFSDRRRRIGDTEKNVDSVLRKSTDRPINGVDNWRAAWVAAMIIIASEGKTRTESDCHQ